MKKFAICFFAISLGLIIILFSAPAQANSDYLRIHIRANSNLQVDQSVKFLVKDAVVDHMIPLLATCQTKEESILTVQKNLASIESVATSVLAQNGFSYTASAKVCAENFPTRTYGDLTLDEGFYDALIISLGTGQGNNWWCVVYPPLCFVNGSGHVNSFKSRILEIISSFFA